MRIRKAGELDQHPRQHTPKDSPVNIWLDAFLADIPQTDDCIEWPFSTAGLGYGQVWKTINGKKERCYAHRLVLEHTLGAPLEDLLACHTCDNMICINPRHLFPGTSKDNSVDMSVKGRSTRGEKQPHSKLTEDAVRDIRNSLIPQGVSFHDIAEFYGVSWASIKLVSDRKTWKHVE